MSSLIEIKDLCVGYPNNSDGSILVDKINVKIESGEVIALLGLNGCGKTTLLKTILGEHKALKGNIFFNRKAILEYSSQELAQQVASVSTRYNNPGQLTVSELVAFGRYPFTGRLHFLENDDIKQIQVAIESVGIQNLKEKFVEELSDGERQKVMLACAIAQNTPILIMDEPTSHLDVRNKVAMMNLIKGFAKNEEKTILFSTHDLALARNVASRIWLIHDHKILDEETEYFMNNKSWKPLLEGIDEELINWL